jgi:hypothetical protein
MCIEVIEDAAPVNSGKAAQGDMVQYPNKVLTIGNQLDRVQMLL